MNLKTFLLVLVLLMGLCLPAIGQGRPVMESEMRGLLHAAAELRRTLAYRLTESDYLLRDRNSTDGPWSTWTSEYSPPDSTRMIIWKTKPGGPVSMETISIGNDVFTKRGTGEWNRETRSARQGEDEIGSRPPCGRTGKSSGSDWKLECVHMGTDVLNGESAELYETTRTTTFTRSSQVSVEIFRWRYWFNTKGLLLKEEIEQEIVGSTRLHRVIREYRYDPTIKIEPPIK